MLTESEIADLKVGDKIRLCGFNGKYYESYNGMIVVVVDPHYKIISSNLKSKHQIGCIQFTPSFQQDERECDLVHYDNIELIEDNMPFECMCDISHLIRSGCTCGGL